MSERMDGWMRKNGLERGAEREETVGWKMGKTGQKKRIA